MLNFIKCLFIIYLDNRVISDFISIFFSVLYFWIYVGWTTLASPKGNQLDYGMSQENFI